MLQNSFLKLFLILLFSMFSCQTSFACMFGPPYKTVCDNYALASSVIVGEIESVETKGYAQKVFINVKCTYKGRHVSRLVLNQPLSTCDWDFSGKQGETMLLYLGRDKKTQAYSAIAEGAGGSIARVNEDLYWLNKLPGALKRTRISGTISLYRDRPFDFLNHIFGTEVRVFNEQHSYQAVTDKNGVFEVWDLPRGKYTIKPLVPIEYIHDLVLSKGHIDFKRISDVEVDTNDFKVEIKPELCGGADYVFNKP